MFLVLIKKLFENKIIEILKILNKIQFQKLVNMLDNLKNFTL